MSGSGSGTFGQPPVIYEVNTAIWLAELSRRAGQRVTLGDVGPVDWAAVTPTGVDAVWLMGVWERSPAALAAIAGNAELQASFREALPDVSAADVIGSPYCVRRYVVDSAFGGPEGLAAARAALASRGTRLILDYVPNHVAPDHPWLTSRPDLFIHGDERDLAADPAAWTRAAGYVLAHGRDPYFPPWPDVVQLNAFAPQLRAATIETLIDIGKQCDGVRCDMAMLMINDVFAGTWREHAGARPDEEFWPHVIDGVRAGQPGMLFIAEAYWNLEWELQRQGFDFCYDKRLYDRLVTTDAGGVRDHLHADLTYQSRLVRFLENHDEPRIAEKLSVDAERAAAVAIATLPGATLWHEGQFEGRRVRPPVFLARRPDEPVNRELADWYHCLLATVANQALRSGEWRGLQPTGWPDNQSCRNLLSWTWTSDGDGDRHVVVVNLSAQAAQGRIPLGYPDLPGRQWNLSDLLTDVEFDRDGAELADPGLFVDLPPWQFYVLALR